MAKVKRTRGKTKMRRGKLIDRIEAVAVPTPNAKNSVRRAVIHWAERAEDTVRPSVSPQGSDYDFYARVSASELARSQGVHPIRRLGQIRTFRDPHPEEADWFAREVRRWRCESGSRLALR
jgi:hypothetical protein